MESTAEAVQPQKQESEKCNKCSAPIDTTGYPKWCKACRAKYKREYTDTVEAMTAARAFNQGVDAFRETLAMEFARHGKAPLTGTQVSWIISNSPRPTYKSLEAQGVPTPGDK